MHSAFAARHICKLSGRAVETRTHQAACALHVGGSAASFVSLMYLCERPPSDDMQHLRQHLPIILSAEAAVKSDMRAMPATASDKITVSGFMVQPFYCTSRADSEFAAGLPPIEDGFLAQFSRVNTSSLPFWCLTSCVALPVLSVSVVKLIWIGLTVAKKSWSV